MQQELALKTKELHNNKSDIKISSYKDALDLAKKVFNEINKDY